MLDWCLLCSPVFVSIPSSGETVCRFRLPLVVVCLLLNSLHSGFDRCLLRKRIPSLRRLRTRQRSPIEVPFSRARMAQYRTGKYGWRVPMSEGIPGDSNIVYVATALGRVVEDDEWRVHLETILNVRASSHWRHSTSPQ